MVSQHQGSGLYTHAQLTDTLHVAQAASMCHEQQLVSGPYVTVTCCTGTSLVACGGGMLRTLGHLQVLAATNTLAYSGISGTYGEAARELEWAMLRWLPDSLTSFAQQLGTYPAMETGQLVPTTVSLTRVSPECVWVTLSPR